MILAGSYANGFAPRDGSPLYPELWRGCVGAWAPCLGPTGVTLRDWSGRSNHSSDVIVSQWAVRSGGWATKFGSTDFYTIPHTAALQPANGISVSVWCKINSTTGNPFLLDKNYVSSWWLQAFGTNQIEWGIRNVATGVIDTDTNAFPTAALTHIAGTFSDSADRMIVYINGRPVISSTSITSTIASNTDALYVGRRNSAATNFLNGEIHEVRVYDRELTQNEVAFLAMRRGIAYELAPRRRSSSGVAFNRRRRLLVGAGS